MTTPPIDRGQADRFLELLGKDPAAARLRAFPHRLNPDRATIRARSGPYDLATASRWQQEQRGVYLVTGNGGDRDSDITSCPALFVEWDHRPLVWQLEAWREFGLGEPTVTITTGGKSAHLYWVLAEPIPPEQWAPIQSALIEITGADPTNRNPSRVMRLPGAFYLGPDGQATGQTLIHSATGTRYTVEQVESWIIAAATTQQQEAQQRPRIAIDDGPAAIPLGDLPPRPPEALREALAQVPPFAHGTGQYQQLLGLAMRLHVEIGATEAQQLLAETCCQAITDLPGYFGERPTSIHPGSIWPYLREHWGINIARDDLRGKPTGAPQQAQHGPHGDQQGNGAADAAEAHQGPRRGPLLTLAEVRERFAYAVEGGASRADLEALRLELAAASDIPAASLVGLLRSIEAEQEGALSIAAEARNLRDAQEQREFSAGWHLDYLVPHSIANALRVRTRWLPSDDVAALVTFLVCCSGVVKLGSEIVASEAADYRVPLNLYGALVARSGAKKSPLSRLLVDAPTRALRLDLAREHTRAMEAWTEQNRGVKASERPDPPQAAYLSVSDATAEALAHQLQIQEQRGLGLLLHRDELAGLFGGLNQYRGGRGSDSEQLLEAYDGSGFRSLRVAATGGGRFYDRCHLSIWGTIQPAVLQGLVANGDASGLWARYLFVPLPERVVRLADEESPEEAAAAAHAAQILAAVAGWIYKLPRTSLSLSPCGRRAFMQYEARCQGDALRATLPAQGALFGKAPGKALRLAALLHLLHQAAHDGHHSPTIDGEAIGRATGLCDHLNAWTLSLHADAAAGGANDLMRLVHRVAMASAHPISWRDLAGRLSRQQRREIDSAQAAAAMDALAALGVGQVERGPRGGASYRATGELA